MGEASTSGNMCAGSKATKPVVNKDEDDEGPFVDEDADPDSNGDSFKQVRLEQTSNDRSSASSSRPPNPLVGASLWSRLLFRWPYSIIKTGNERIFTESDLPELLPWETSAHNSNLLEGLWKKELQRCQLDGRHVRAHRSKRSRKRPSLHRAILRHFLSSLWFVQPMHAVMSAARIGQGLALGLLIEYFEEGDDESLEGYLWASVLVASSISIMFMHHHIYFHTWRAGMRYKIACVATIFSNSMKLSSIGGTTSIPAGQVMNLASNDVERFSMACLFFNYLFWGPVEAVTILVIGTFLVGPAFAAGFVLMFALIPLQIWLSRRFTVLRGKIAAVTDSRVTLVAQAIWGVRVMKMSGWETQFQERIAERRAKEIQQVQKANRLRALNEAIFFFSSTVVSTVIFTIHVLMGGELTPRTVFSTLTLVNVVQFTMTKFFAFGVMGASECYVSIRRIQKFLELPKLHPDGLGAVGQKVQSTSQSDEASDCMIQISNLTCYWSGPGDDSGVDESSGGGGKEAMDSSSSSVALSNISVAFQKGELTCVVGPVGSGKSALLLALAGELPIAHGTIERRGRSMAYAAQDPWIMDGTIRENVLMGLPFRPGWYEEVVRACGLQVDFSHFRDGDATLVGDRGVQCSGGQRARIGLARVLYRDAEVLLLDDPLSAVDANVGRLIFYSAIQDICIKRGKCVILATHQHQFIGDSRCVLMERGRVAFVGSYDGCLSASGGALSAALQTSETDGHEASDKHGAKEARKDIKLKEKNEKESSGISGDGEDTNELSEKGIVKLRTWTAYAEAMGGLWVGILLLLLFAASQAAVIVDIFFIGNWAEQDAGEQDSVSSLVVIVGLGALCVIMALVKAVVGFHFCILASQRLHDRMTLSVLRARIDFFDTNPLGRILNRFSADVGINDDMLPQTLYDTLTTVLTVAGSIVTALTILPYSLVTVPFLLFFFLRVRRAFLKTSREVKRLDGVTRSPVFAMLSEALNGIATIRSNDGTEFFRQKFQNVHDANARAFFAFISTSRWLGFRMDSIALILVTVSSYLTVLFNQQDWLQVEPVVIGLAFTLMLQLGMTFQWAVRQTAEVVNQMVGVERVTGFSRLPSEAPLDREGDRGLKDWPKTGSLEVRNLTLRYRPQLPLVLNDVSFRVESGQRIGVVGRTGSGKSTLVQALFRLLEAESGEILVDGVNIATIGLHKLRKEMSVIPQSPVLFDGCTVRENLDPFGSYDEETIRKALEDVQMLDAIEELPEGLDFVVSQGGTFSVGQKQLVCLARAILRKNRILVLDEPTANVDSHTDSLLQEAVQRSFPEATIISIAHRLDTVIDYDCILVMGPGGKVLEFGPPTQLLDDPNGHFRSMVEETGEKMSKHLRHRASSRILAI